MPPTIFEPDRLYAPADPALRQIAQQKTLANWRSAGRGPRWVKLNRRMVRYRGADLNDWLAENLDEVA